MQVQELCEFLIFGCVQVVFMGCSTWFEYRIFFLFIFKNLYADLLPRILGFLGLVLTLCHVFGFTGFELNKANTGYGKKMIDGRGVVSMLVTIRCQCTALVGC